MSTRFNYKAYNCLKSIQHLVLPGTCIVCQASSLLQRDLCTDCERKLPVVNRPCSRCALPLPGGNYRGRACGACLTRPPPFHYSVSAFEYQPPVKHLIADFKYFGKLCNGKVLADLLARKLEIFYQQQTLPQLIIPVPLHRRRLRERGFNQASELGGYLSKRLNIPLDRQLCTRVLDSQAQMSLSAQKRKKNLRGAFILSEKLTQSRNIAPIKTIAIVDDVVTTMSTVTELSKVLLASGVQEIHIWSLARACK